MKPRIILHIGMHKTGSSSLQRVFSRNRWLLALAGIHYWAPKTGAFKRASKATDLYSAITHEASGQGPHPLFGPAEKILEAIAERAKRQTVLVSAEGLSGQDPAYARAFGPLKGQVQVVLYLRRQDHWVESFYRQMVKSAEVAERRPFEAFLADPWTMAHLDFLALADRWADAVGPEALQVRVYPSERPLLVDFLNTTQLPQWIAKLPYAQNRANPSLSPAQVALKTGLPQDQVGFADDQARASFLARFSVQNLDICKKYRPDLKTLFPI